jgi:hypothetical protein
MEENVHFSRYAAGAFAAATLLGATEAQAQTAPTPAPAPAQNGEDITALRHDMESLRQEYEGRIADLEARLARAEAAEGVQPTTPADQTAAPTASPADTTAATTTMDQSTAPVTTDVASNDAGSTAGPSSQSLYNPGMSVVLNGFLTAASHDTGSERIAGVASGGEIENPPRGFSLGESEFGLSSNIDPYFYGFLVVALDNEGAANVEEAYIQTTSMPAGLTLTAGRFFSGIGYANEMHAHNWAFSDAALPYRAFLGSQLGDDGVQLTWLAPTDQFLLFGVEALRGESYPAAGARNSGIGSYSAFVRTGNDIDVSNSYLASVSYLHTQAADRETDGDLFSGHDDLVIGSLTYKWAPGGNRLNQNFTATGEVFVGNENGTLNGIPVDQDRFGWYVQGIYQFMPRWRVGLRYAALHTDDPGPLLAGSTLDDLGINPYTATALIEWDGSEFSRLRLQYSHDESDFQPNDIVTMQYTVIYGLHGAHRY